MATFPAKPWSDGQTYEVVAGQTFRYNGTSQAWEYVTNLAIDSEVQTGLTAIELKTDSDSQRITDLKATVALSSSDITSLTARLDSDEIAIQATKTTLSSEVSRLDARLDSDSIVIQRLRYDLSILDSNLDSDVADIKALRRDADSDSAALQLLSGEAKANAASIQTTLAMLDSDGTVLQSLRTDLDAEIATTGSEINTINARLDSDEAAIQAVRTDLTAQITTVQSRLDSDSAVLQSLQGQVDALNLGNVVLENDHDSDVAAINATVDALPLPVISATQPTGQAGLIWISLTDGRLYYWHATDEAWTEIVTGA